MSWRFPLDTGGEIDTLRRRTAAALAHRLVRPEHVPSVSRVLAVGWRLGWALLAWGSATRHRDSRAGLSRRLRPAFERLGPTYIKLGQIISSGEGIFPEELVDEFRLLRDQVPPEPFADVRRIIEEDLGRPLRRSSASFDRDPLAAASIAQVHAATLRTGERVVVKVQRPHRGPARPPGPRRHVWIAPLLVGPHPRHRSGQSAALVELFAETIVEELDFRLEAQNMLDIARVLADDGPDARSCPRPHPAAGDPAGAGDGGSARLRWGDVAGDARRRDRHRGRPPVPALIAFLEGALLYGVFHGDLHGGNLLVHADGHVALLDFGITGRLDESKRLAFLR